MMLVAFLALLLVVVLYGLKRQGRRQIPGGQEAYERYERAKMPRVLARGRLLVSETYYRTEVPRRLGARFDQVYLGEDGVLYPVETKRRDKVTTFTSDVVEISVQAAVLRGGQVPGTQGRTVSRTGYVRIVTNAGTEYRAVRLLSDDELARLFDRRSDILMGRVLPNMAERLGQCIKCVYLADCRPGTHRVQSTPN